MIFTLLLPMESKIPISFLRPLIQIVRSRVSITTLTTEIIIIVVFTNFCRDSKGVVQINAAYLRPLYLIGMLLIAVAVIASSWTVVHSKPKDILTKMS